MEKKQAKLCKTIDGISWWLYNGKDRGVPEKCFLQNGVQAAERIFRHALRKETTGRPADRLRQNKAVAEKKQPGPAA